MSKEKKQEGNVQEVFDEVFARIMHLETTLSKFFKIYTEDTEASKAINLKIMHTIDDQIKEAERQEKEERHKKTNN
tara:strand:+ start:1828 stop:2055 length:228 start_codon:yes stop_codon:yes gene_type:complete